MKYGVIVLLFATMVVSGCQKVTLDCLYEVRVMMQQQKTDTVEVLNRYAVGYAFYADTAQWRVASIDDARDGVITNRKSGLKRNFDIRSEVLFGQKRLGFKLTKQPVILSVYDPITQAYAWRHAEIAENMPSVMVVLKFRLWRWAESPFVENRWVINIPEQIPVPNE